MKFLPASLLIFAAISLTACGGSSADLEYLDSRVMPNLEIPPDLTLINVDSDFKLPEIFSGDNTEARNSIPVLAKVDSIKLEGHSDYYWLSIDEPVDNLYQLVKDFWASEGFTLAMDEPVIGTMKTDWVFNKEGEEYEDKSFLARIFSSDDLAESQDQFKTRIARDAGTGASQVYITHRGTQVEPVLLSAQEKKYDQVHLLNIGEGDDWIFRVSEPELEVEMLSRLMLYLGLRQSEVDGQLANIKLFAPRVSIHTEFSGDESDDENYLLVKEKYTRAWYRTLHQLERLDLKVISANPETGFTNKGVIEVETNIDMEVDASGFFSFGSETKIVKKQVNLIFSEESSEITRITIETGKGDNEDSTEGIEFLTLLFQYMK